MTGVQKAKTEDRRPLENKDLENEDPLENEDLENEDPLENKDLENKDPLENEDLENKDPPRKRNSIREAKDRWHNASFGHVLWKQPYKFYGSHPDKSCQGATKAKTLKERRRKT